MPGVYASVKAGHWVVAKGAKILGDAEVRDADLHGATAIRGKLTGETVKSTGSLDVGGAVTLSGQVTLKGDTRFGGPVSLGSLALDGTLSTGDSLTVAKGLTGRGRIAATGDLAAATIRFAGGVTVTGTLRAKRIELTVDREGSIAAIEGGRVRLHQGGSLFGRRPSLAVLQLEATEANLEAVRCEYVRAPRIILGPHAHVARYDGTIVHRHRTSHVGPESTSPPPVGLSR